MSKVDRTLSERTYVYSIEAVASGHDFSEDLLLNGDMDDSSIIK